MITIRRRIPPDSILKCRMYRKSNMLDRLFPSFFLYNETDDKFLLSARKWKKAKTVHYVISTVRQLIFVLLGVSAFKTNIMNRVKMILQRTLHITLPSSKQIINGQILFSWMHDLTANLLLRKVLKSLLVLITLVEYSTLSNIFLIFSHDRVKQFFHEKCKSPYPR
jgi:hypothetical protein